MTASRSHRAGLTPSFVSRVGSMTNTPNAPRKVAPCIIVRLAAAASCDPRTAKRALESGLDAVRGSHLRDRIEGAALLLGLTLPCANAEPPRAA